MFDNYLSNFSGGEVSEEIYGRFDSDLYKNSLQRCENFISLIQGPLQYRGGFSYMHPTRLQQAARKELFKFSDEQAYILEFTDAKLRIYEDSALTLKSTSKTITGITQASPGVLTSVGHGFVTDDEIYVASVGGMTQLNGRFFRVVRINNDTFSLKDLFGTAINTSSYTAYTAGGTATLVFELTSPYLLADLFEFQIAGEGNIAYTVHRSYEPYKLTRVSATSWTFATYSRTADPFGSADLYPGAVALYEGCAFFASSNTYPDRIWRSMGPDTAGAKRYDNLTTGTAATDAIITSASASSGTVLWLVGLQKFLAIGAEGGVLGLDGGGDAAITPTNLRIRPIDPIGVQGIMPVTSGQSIFYMQKGSRILRSFDYSLEIDSYRSTDRQFLAPHLTVGGIKQLAIQRWKTDLLWAVRNDGVLLCLTIKPKEDISGWHRHVIGGDGEVTSIAVEPQVSGYDRLSIVVKRTINSTTTYYNEYLNDPFEGVHRDDYFTDEASEDTDTEDYLDAVYAAQQDCIYLDGSATYDGSPTDAITGLWHLIGETVSVIADGRLHPDCIVSSTGTIALDRDASVVQIGYKYKGIAIPLNLIVIGAMQNSIAFGKSVSSISLVVSNTVAVKYGTSLYSLQGIESSLMGQDTDAPPVPFTGTIPLANADNWSLDKRLVYVQDDPYPCMLNAMSVTIEVGEK